VHRKQAFEANSYLWGVQAQTQLDCYLFHPSADARRLDLVIMRGFVGLRRIRPNVPWRIARLYVVSDTGELRTSFVREPLDPQQPAGPEFSDVPWMRDFCTTPLPACRRVSGPRGLVEYELVEAPVGNTASHTCMIGEIVRSAGPRYRDEHDWLFVVRARARTPCKVLIFDLLLHRELFGRISARLELFSELFAGELDARYQESDRLPSYERVEYLGCGADAVLAPEVPRYPDMVRHAFDRLGWDSRRFDVYRVRMRFPPIPSALLLTHELPPCPPGLSAGT